MLGMPKNSRLYFTNFTIYFAVIVTSRWSRPDFRSLIQWTVPRLFFLFTDAPHTLIPRQWWYMGWLIGSMSASKSRKPHITQITYRTIKCHTIQLKYLDNESNAWDFHQDMTGISKKRPSSSEGFRRFSEAGYVRRCSDDFWTLPKLFRRRQF